MTDQSTPADEGSEPDAPGPAVRPQVPTQVRIASSLQLVEGLFVALAGLVWIVLSLVDHPDNLGASLMGAILTVAGGLGLVRLAVAVGKGQQWARSPVVAIQFLMLPISFALVFQSGALAYGAPLLAIAIALLYLLFTKPAHAVFDRELRT